MLEGVFMATDGMWVLNDDYEFELAEPNAQQLLECRVLVTKAWRDAILDYLEPRTIYTREQLKDGLMAPKRQDGYRRS